MTDRDLLSRIHRLVAEEHDLRHRHTDPEEGLSDAEQLRMLDLEHELDQVWDLLRRRRACAEWGQDPDAEAERPVAEVTGYLQ